MPQHYDEMARRVVRSFHKIPEPGYPNSTKEEVWDAYLHFFQDAYHLKDWIRYDDELKITKEELNEFINGNPNMKLLQSIVTQAKHLRANDQNIKYRVNNLFWDDGSPTPSPAISYEETGYLLTEDGGYLLTESGEKLAIDYPKKEIHPRRLAIKVLVAWNKFFSDKKLKGSFIIE
jgi:hypothetical protein